MEYIHELQQIGLTKREAEVYLALLQKKEFTAPELAKITTITRTKIYDILQSLVHKGVCNESYKDGQKIFRGIFPKIAFENLITNYEKEFEQKKMEDIRQMKNAALALEKQLAEVHESGMKSNESLDYFEILTDPGQIRKRWLSIQRNTKKELFVFVKPPYTGALDDNVVEETDTLQRKILGRGVYEYNKITSSKEKEELIEILETYERIGEEVRIVEALPMKLVISDETVTMFSLNDRISLKPSITTMIIDHPTFAYSMKRIFFSFWDNALTIEEYKNLEPEYRPANELLNMGDSH